MVKAWAIVRRDEHGGRASLWPAVPADLTWSSLSLRGWLEGKLEGLGKGLFKPVTWSKKKAEPTAVEEHLS